MDNCVFFGNGLNRLISSNISWGELLDKIKSTKKFDDDQLPNTMIYERIVLEKLNKYDNILQDEFDVKIDIATLLDDIKPNELYTELFLLNNVEHYITTNYDYGFIKSLQMLPEVILPIHEYSTEDVYSIRRLKRISNTKERKKHFWQIHGEIRKAATIMLGLDHYCGSIGKIDAYVKGNYKYQQDNNIVVEKSIEDKFKEGSFNDSSWVELFFTSNVHITGFTFDFTEIDLWWVLTRRARMKKSPNTSGLIKNELNFYCHKIENQKKSLLESLYVKVHVVPLSGSSDEYVSHYRQIIKMIEKKI